MKSQYVRSIAFLLFLLAFSNNQFGATPYFNARSQSANLALDMVGQEGYINRYKPDGNYTVLSFTPAFFQSFRGSDIACCLFSPDLVKCGDCSQITISGSGRSDRGSCDWLADYFGLPTDFKSTIQFKPRVRNVLVDASFYFGLDEWCHPGMFFKVHAPFVHTRWELGFCENVADKGSANHPYGYFNSQNAGSTQGVARDNLLNSFEAFAVECKVPDLTPTIVMDSDDTDRPVLNTTTFQPLKYARIAGCNCEPLKRNGLADLRFTLGYNAYMGERYHIGFGLTGAAPTGNRPNGEYAFEPMIGNGNHWELGGQLTSHYEFWASEDEEKSVTGYFDINLTHMFTARQTRTFDLKDRPNSRYMLAEKLGAPAGRSDGVYYSQVFGTNVLDSDFVPAASFKDVFTPVANLSTVDVDVNIGVQVDMVLMLNYTSNNLSFDFGYNLWARSCERIKLNCKCPTKLDDGKTWALKGDAHVYGFCNASSTFSPDWPVALSGTQSKATIHAGTNTQAAIDYSLSASRNPGVDSARPAVNIGPSEDCTIMNVPMGEDSRGQTLTSKDPIFLSNCDLDFDAAATKGLSHKLFGHFSYQWLNKETYVPFLGFGVSGEFLNTSAKCCKVDQCSDSSTSSSKNCNKKCDTGCDRCGLSQWGVWVKGGFSFD